MSSVYPEDIDGYGQLPLVVDKVTPVKAITVNRLRDAIVNVEVELGITPSGDYDTVADRLDNLVAVSQDGGYLGIATSFDFTGSGVSLTLDGYQLEVDISGGVGGSSRFQFTYQQGGVEDVDSGIYTSFADAHTAAIEYAEINHDVDIIIDGSLGTPVFTGSTFNMERIKLIGASSYDVVSTSSKLTEITTVSGTTFTNFTRGIENLKLIHDSTSNLYTLSDSNKQQIDLGTNCIYAANSTGKIFNVTNGTVTFNMGHKVSLLGDVEFPTRSIISNDSANTIIYGNTNCLIQGGTISGSSNLRIYQGAASCEISTTQPDYSGTLTVTKYSVSGPSSSVADSFALWSNTDGHTLKDATGWTIVSGVLTPTTGSFILPNSTSPSQTTEGSIAWDTNDDRIVVGDGTTNKIFYPMSLSAISQGSIIYYDGANLVYLAPGTDGKVLTTHGAGANPTWETSGGVGGGISDPGGTDGDLLYYNSAWDSLPIGSDGDVLTVASGLPSWAPPGSGSGGGRSYVTPPDEASLPTGSIGSVTVTDISSPVTGLKIEYPSTSVAHGQAVVDTGLNVDWVIEAKIRGISGAAGTAAIGLVVKGATYTYTYGIHEEIWTAERLRISEWTSDGSTFNTNRVTGTGWLFGTWNYGAWYKLTYTASTKLLKMEISVDGYNFNPEYAEYNLTEHPSWIGIGGAGSSGPTNGISMVLESWEMT